MNASIGERIVKLGGQELLCRPGFKAFAMIEELTSSSLVEILRRFSDKAPRISDMAAIVYACASQGNKELNLSMDEIGEMIFKEGINSTLADALGLIVTIYSGIEKKDPPAPAK